MIGTIAGIAGAVAALWLVLLVGLAFSPVRARVRAAGLVVTLLGFVLLVLAAKVAIPWYFGTHLGLDNGIGG